MKEKLSEKIARNLADGLADRIKALYVKDEKIIIEATSDKEMFEETDEYALKMGITNDKTRKRIASNMGSIAKWASDELAGNIVIFGGDILQAYIEKLGGPEIYPLFEIKDGVVLSKVDGESKNICLVSKSGGFGDRDIILKIEDFLKKYVEARR
jgi:uncharacterized protein YgbK (DUF1537 family)